MKIKRKIISFELDEKEMNYLCQLIALGHYVVDYTCKDKDESELYNQVICSLASNYFSDTEIITLTKQQIRTVWRTFFSKSRHYLEQYEWESVPRILAKMLVSYHYPLDDTNDWESRLKNLAAEEIYKKTIEEKGGAAIHIDIPDFETQMEQLMKNYKQAENIEN